MGLVSIVARLARLSWTFVETGSLRRGRAALARDDRFERLLEFVGGGREGSPGADDDADAARQRFAADAELMQPAGRGHRFGEDADPQARPAPCPATDVP